MKSAWPLGSAALAPEADEQLWLLGTTGLEAFVDFVRKRSLEGKGRTKVEIADPWREAAAHFESLQKSQQGAADAVEVLPLSDGMQAHVDKVVTLPHFRRTFSSVPVAFGMVELDRLVVYQQHIERRPVEAMLQRFPSRPDTQQLVDVCLPLSEPPAEFRVVLEEGRQAMFVSDTHDARFLGAQLVEPGAITGLSVPGHAQAILALAVGYSPNALNVVRYGKRMVLHNGYHRAYALRARGVTHAPCLIQVCAHWEEVGLAAGGPMYENGTFYFGSPRPPLLRDFFDPALSRPYRVPRRGRAIRLRYEVDASQPEV